MSILVATDLSEASRAAVRTAARLAAARDTSLTVAHFIEMPRSASWAVEAATREKLADEAREKAHSQLASFVDETLGDEHAGETIEVRVETGPPDPGIAELVDAIDATVVVIGATGRDGVARRLLGSTAEDVVRRSARPVLVVPADQPVEAFSQIVAPVDLSACSRASLEATASLARSDGAGLEIVHAAQPPGASVSVFDPMIAPISRQELIDEYRERFDDFVAEFDLEDLEAYTRFQAADPVELVEETIEDLEADLVVLGTHGRRGVEKLFLGNTATKILRDMPCAVMAVRSSREAESAD